MDPGGQTATAQVTTGFSSNENSAGATLQGSYSGATGEIKGRGFVIGTSADALTSEYSAASSGSSFSTTVSDLQSFTTYYYKAFVKEGNNSTYRYGDIHSFTTNVSSGSTPSGSLELPSSAGDADKRVSIKKASNSSATNYTFNYSYSRYASLWTAYSLTESDVLDAEPKATWNAYSGIDAKYQIKVDDKSYPTNYPVSTYPQLLSQGNPDSNDYFARGHQIPAADRKNTSDKNQTYLLTNQAPQIQNSFNSGIWSLLEKAGRQFVVTDPLQTDNYNSSFKTTDVLYIVTGPCYQKVGGNETVYTLTGADSSIVPHTVPVPNYYWKAFLKVRMSGNNVVSASAIGFWMEHKKYSNSSYTDHVVTVDKIEEWTGFDLFANLPNNLEAGAEANNSWVAFRDF